MIYDCLTFFFFGRSETGAQRKIQVFTEKPGSRTHVISQTKLESHEHMRKNKGYLAREQGYINMCRNGVGRWQDQGQVGNGSRCG